MSDDNPHSSNGSSGKSVWAKFVQTLTGEPKNKQELVEVLNDAEDRELIKPETKQMIEGVLGVSDLRVRDIMIPRSQMVTLDINQPLEEILPIILESGHSRFPVINEDVDNIEGMLLAKDLLAYGFNQQAEDCTIKKIIRDSIIVPESKKVEPLLKEFRSKRYHMAVVVDEYGGVSGLVTIEDILELIVGEIEDETDDHEEASILPTESGAFTVEAITEISDFNEFFDVGLADDEFDTVGGLVLHALGRLPELGETITIDNFHFKVTGGDNRKITQLEVTKVNP